jgi:RNA polymerase sigma factor (sigma-70 family)
VEDREIVAAIVAGDPVGLAEAYDRYAAALYTYCRTMLRESADASDAVQDTFVIASAKLSQLRDPAKLRSWLYAVARNECYRRLRGKEITPGLDEVPDVTDETAAVGADAERVELQQLVHDALIGMNVGDRELIELMIRHDFEGNELSDVLGVSRNHAHAMLSRARNQLKTSLGALLVARTGRRNCEVLNQMLASWDGTMTILLRKQVNRHIENCEVCEDRRRRELAPAALFSLMPLVAVPPGLRERILRLCSDDSPLSVRQRQRITAHAGAFGPDGFPAAAAIPMMIRLRSASRGRLLALPAAAVLVVAVVIIVALAATGSPKSSTVAGALSTTSRGAAAPLASVGTPATTPASQPATHKADASVHQHAGPGATPTLGAATAPATTGVTTATSTAPASASTHAPTHAPSHPASPTPTHTSTSAPPSPTPSPSPSPSPSPTPAKGTLTLSVSEVTLTANSDGGSATGAFTMTASGGPVMGYTVTVPDSYGGLFSASPTSGVLGAGQSATITLTLTRPVAVDETLVIDPGALSVTVIYNPPTDSKPSQPPSVARLSGKIIAR